MNQSLISVIITCYNHGHYLAEAIDSVIAQNYNHVEIVVIDDGSTDNTKEVASKYSSVKYIYQANKGLSTARNRGVEHSAGEFILFLDADDWLLPSGLYTNHRFLINHPEAAFVSGDFKILKVARNEMVEMRTEIKGHHFNRLLEFNYISMIAAVLFRRWVFDEFYFDATLEACEDYDLYFKVTRKYQVAHHNEFIAVYRFHDSNMSGNTANMMNTAIETIKKQEQYLLTKKERESFKKGIRDTKLWYSKLIYVKYFMPEQQANPNRKTEMHALWKNSKPFYFRFYLKRFFNVLQRVYKKINSWFYIAGIA
jgi:glycosyltransferase involved in cell wall biosynthesis